MLTGVQPPGCTPVSIFFGPLMWAMQSIAITTIHAKKTILTASDVVIMTPGVRR
jgi:hypothetical protein